MGSYHPQTRHKSPVSRSPNSVKASFPNPEAELPPRWRKQGACDRARPGFGFVVLFRHEAVRPSRFSGYRYHLNKTPVSRTLMFYAVFCWSTLGDPGNAGASARQSSPSLAYLLCRLQGRSIVHGGQSHGKSGLSRAERMLRLLRRVLPLSASDCGRIAARALGVFHECR